MRTIELVTGDPLIKTLNLLKKNDAGEATFNIPVSATVTAAIVSEDHARKLTGDISVSDSETGADWSTSKLVVNIPKTETATITEYGCAHIEVQVNDTTELTWFFPVTIIKGQIN